MKKIYLPLFLVVGLTSQAQILTNSNPAATITGSSVILDASTNYSQQAGESNNKHKGMVIPSVDLVNFEFDMTLADGATFPTYFDGMIVYNRSTGTTLTAGNRSSTATAVVPGYYYFYNPSGSVNGNVKGGQWRSVANDATATSKGVVQLAGDLTGTSESPTIANNAVTSTKILDDTVANVDLAAGAGGIYKGNGTLSGNTFVDQGSNTLTFISNAVNGFSVAGNTLSVDGANARVGIGNSGPRARLSFSQTLENKKIALWDDAVFVDDVHQYYGFGVNNSMLRYQVSTLAARHAFFAAISGAASIELMTINGNGNVGVGISSPTSKFEVNGAATNTGAFNAGLATTIDFSLSNLAYTLANPGNTFTLNNLKNGGTYSLAVRGGTSGTASFSASGFTFKSSSNGPTTAGKETVYTFLVMGTTVYVYMNSGL